MKKLYILLMHTHTRVSEFVRLMTRYSYSHVALSFEESCEVIYSFGRRDVHSVLNGGLSVEHRDGAFFRTFPHAECIIYEIEVTEEQYARARQLVEWMEQFQEIYRYDFLGIAFRFLGFPVTFQNRYVCSYFVAYVLDHAGIYRFPKRVCLIQPRDFYALEGFREIYRGPYLAWYSFVRQRAESLPQ